MWCITSTVLARMTRSLVQWLVAIPIMRSKLACSAANAWRRVAPMKRMKSLYGFHHGASGLGFLPTTADSFTYDGVVWKVTTVDPTYSSKTLIASKITGRG